MGVRRAGGWLEQWRAEEPLRLYLWSVAAAVLAGGVGTGLLTERWALAISGVAAAVLMLGGTAAARGEAFAPATVDRLLDEQHATSYQKGYTAALRTVEEAAGPAVTQELRATPPPVPGPSTQPREALRRCGYVDGSRRCTMREHPATFGHQLERGTPVE